ncbi:MAG: methyltransferase domain-containing protein [Chloroflexi bacterium]|nr:methyltransferase domain-containing protein [Chloroflexota bacterium]
MTATTQTPKIDETKLNAVIGQVVSDFGATASAALMVLGDKLGLYKAMSESGPTTSQELAARTGTVERYVRDWLVNQAASGYVDYDPQTERYTLPPESALALAQEDNPYFVVGGFELFLSMIKAEPEILEAFRTGAGLTWGQHDEGLFVGCERFFKPGYLGNLVANWLPALQGVVPRLEAGAKVADVGCGYGASTIIMARAFPNSRFWGFDDHAPSIERAQQEAAVAGVADRITFQVASAQDYPSTEGVYDLVTYFDCLHDMGDPTGAISHTARSLSPDGTVMIVEPMAGERVEENLNPVGRIYSAASVMLCTPNAVATGHTHLGTIATEASLREVVRQGGLSTFRRATETPFNRIFEARR